MKKNNNYWIYILLCHNNNYYTGYTINLEKRYQAHQNGTASKYTRSFKPLRLVKSWKIIGTKSFAMKIESQIKKLSRAQKEQLIASSSYLLDICKSCSNSSYQLSEEIIIEN